MGRLTTFSLLLVVAGAAGCSAKASGPAVDPGGDAEAPAPSGATPLAPSGAAVPPDGPAEQPAETPTDAGDTQDGAIDEIVFRFHDSSVPPKYHRSYTIVATPKSIQKTVDSYGDIISDETGPLTKAEFDALVAALKTHAIKPATDSEQTRGCTGGTAKSLTLHSRGKPVLEGRVAKCGSTTSGNLAGDLDAFGAELNKRAPNGLKNTP